MHNLKIGDVVRVKEIQRFLVEFGRKVKDRDAIVLQVGPNEFGMFKGRIYVEFQKRNGRGKSFKSWLRIEDVEKK